MRTVKLSRAFTAVCVAGVLTCVGGVVASADNGHAPSKERICHPVEGKGEYGNGWNVIDVSQMSKHFRDGKPKHYTKDGRHDFIAKPGEFCHEGGTPSTTSTPSSTTTGQSSTSTTSTTTSPTTSHSSSTTTTSSSTAPSSSTTSTTRSTTSSTTKSGTTSSPTTSRSHMSPTTRSSSSTTSALSPASPKSSVTPSGELAHTGVNRTGTLIILAAFLIMLGALFYIFRGTGRRH